MAQPVMNETVENGIQRDSSERYCKEMLQNLNNLRHEDTLCDVALVVEGKEFKAHRCVLATSSPYFRNMFTTDMQEKSQSRICIEALCSSIMEDLLSYLYTGAVEIEGDSNARELLSAADYLMLPRLKKMAGDYVLRNLKLSNCISTYYLPVVARSEMLKDGVHDFINKNFVPVAKCEEFVNLSVEQMIDWISSDDIKIRAEEDVFDVVINWIEHSPESRKVCLSDLLCHVRLTLVPHRNLLINIMKNGLIRDNVKCMDLVMKSMEMQAMLEDESLYEKPRKCLDTHVHCLLACGGRTWRFREGSEVNCCFVPDQGKWYSLTNLKTGRTGHCVALCEGYVYIVGGYISQVESAASDRYDPRTNTWVGIAPLPVNMVYGSIVSLRGLLYACGGNTINESNYSKQVFEYNPSTNTWKEVASLIHGRRSFSTVCANQHIYAIGGRITDSNYGASTNTVERFDPSSNNTWMLISPMKEKRKCLIAAAFKNKIYIFGGIIGEGKDQNEGSVSAEMYDIVTDQWQNIANMQVPRMQGSACAVRGIIYVIGGNRPSRTCATEGQERMIECYNPVTGEWTVGGSVPCQECLSYCMCCPVTIPKSVLRSQIEN